MEIYEEELNRNEELKLFDDAQKVRTEALINAGKGGRPFQCVKEVVTYMDDLNRKIEQEFFGCRERILGAGTNNEIRRKNEEHLDYLFDEYSRTSQQMVILCTDLLEYVKSARKIGISIRKMTDQNTRGLGVNDYKTIFNKLQPLKLCAESLLEKIRYLRKRNEEMLKKLTSANEKLQRELQRSGSFKTFTSMMFIAAKAGMLICAILTAVLASDPHVQAVLAAVSAGFEVVSSVTHWITKMTKDWEDHLQDHQRANRSMQQGTRVAINDLDGIEDCINKVLMEIETLSADGNSKNENAGARGGEGSSMIDGNQRINEKLVSFLSSIHLLEIKTKNCKNNISNSRDNVGKEYKAVKERLQFQAR